VYKEYFEDGKLYHLIFSCVSDSAQVDVRAIGSGGHDTIMTFAGSGSGEALFVGSSEHQNLYVYHFGASSTTSVTMELYEAGTFKPRNVVTIDTTGDGTGVQTYTAANGDFTKFGIMRGDYLMAYSSSVTQLALIEPTPKGYGSVSGDQTGSASFTVATSTASSVQMQARGFRLEAGKINGQNLSNLRYKNGALISADRGEAGQGFGTNAAAAPDAYTIVETSKFAVECILIDTIDINVTVDGGIFRVGCGTLSGSTFTPRVFRTITTNGTGQKTYTATNGDFAAFEMQPGDRMYMYSDDLETRPLRATDGSPVNYGYVIGDHMEDASFTITVASGTRLQMRGEGYVL
jgi:hypothetical protein